jgi:hypothetical protein
MSEALNDVRQRCEAVGIECEDDASSLLIWFPRGRDTYDHYVEEGPHAEWVANHPFEEYVRLKGYEASWSSSHRMIECNLVLSDTNYSPILCTPHRLMSGVLDRLNRAQHGASSSGSSSSRRVNFETTDELIASIGWCSDVHAKVREATGYSDDPEDREVQVDRALMLQIRGTDVTYHDSAV